MATLPRSSKFPSSIARPVSEFDAGLNTSTAWTEHLDVGISPGVSGRDASKRQYLSESGIDTSLSDDELDGRDLEETRPARALYRFQGKAEFRELSVEAGDQFEVVKEDVGDGWSLVQNVEGEIGLVPRSYYTFISTFTSASLDPDSSKRREASSDSITPHGSPRLSQPPLYPQNTGEWFPSFRRSLLGGKSFNRFSSFVTSGAEEFILRGSTSPPDITLSPSGHIPEGSIASIEEENFDKLSSHGLREADRHFIDVGPSWREKIPPFRILVHSPSKRTSLLSGAYTVYSVTSIFHAPGEDEPEAEERRGDDDQNETVPATVDSPLARITVLRRFSHFVVLHTALTRRLPGIALPPLPEKQYSGRFSDDFVEARRGDLERYIDKIVRHPVARYAEIVTFFLACESDTEWNHRLPAHLSMPPAGPAFYSQIYHPAFNLDAEDAEDAGSNFETHLHAVGKGVQGLRAVFGRVRDARIEMSKAERLLSYSLLSLITARPLLSPPTNTGVDEENYIPKAKSLINSEGAWCWREGCQGCLKLTKAMQKTSETLQNVADLYDDHARRSQLATHESLKSMAHPSSIYEGVVTTHKAALSRYHKAISAGHKDDEVVSRCETILNTTMAEMEAYHTQKIEDFRAITTEHLDGEIAFYEQIILRLQTARRKFDKPTFDQLAESPRQTSIYERDLENPKLAPKPLSQPCPHVFDSTPMRPVSAAIQEGVNILLGPTGRLGRWPL